MPDFGAPVADQIIPPNPNQASQTLQTLSGIVGLANQQQQLQLGQQQLQVGAGTAQSAQQQLDERQMYQSALSSGKDPDGNPIKNPDGTLNYPAVSKFANKYLPITGQQVQQGIIQTLDNANTYHTNALKLTNDQRSAVSGVLASGIGEPDSSGVMARLDTLAQQNPDIAPFIKTAQQSVSSIPAGASPDQRNKILMHAVQGLQPAGTTAAQQAPQIGTTTGPGGGVQAFQTNPLSAVPQGATGPETAQGISPVQAATRVPAFQNGQPGTVPLGSITPGAPGYNGGNSPFGSGRYNSQPGANGAFAPSGAPMGQAGLSDQMNYHWSKLNSDASHAQTNIGLAQNIKAYADQALTGKQGDKLSQVNGLLSVFGVSGQTDLSTATDLLNKNMSRLSLSSRAGAGGTDAAGALASAANPHGSMTAAAIKEAADQVISSQKMALSEQNLLKGYRQNNDVQGYQNALTQFNNVADPRIWQFSDMNPAQRAQFKSQMSPAEQKEFGSKIRGAEQLGVVQ